MMTAAVFKATYADWKLVKTRGVVQVVFEVPLANEQEAYKVVGGMPDPARERWFAVARLNPEAKEETTENSSAEQPRQSPPAGGAKSYAQEAGRLCNDVRFERFLSEKYPVAWHAFKDREDAAAEVLRRLCFVNSRRQIVEGTSAAAHFKSIVAEYELERT